MRSQEIKRVKEGKANKKERSAESIISSMLGIMRVKCLRYFKVKVSKKTYRSRFQKKKVKYRKFFENDTGLLTTSLRTKYELSISQKKNRRKTNTKKSYLWGWWKS